MALPAYQYEDYDDGTEVELAVPLERAVASAEHGNVIYLTRHRRRVAAVLPADIAERALEALEDAEDVRDVLAARQLSAPRVPHEVVLAEFADELAEVERS